jgi:hypothetical protein
MPAIPPPPAAPAPKPAKVKTVLVMCRMSNAKKFLADLRTAIDACAGSGGGYSAFLPLKDDTKLQIEVNHD